MMTVSKKQEAPLCTCRMLISSSIGATATQQREAALMTLAVLESAGVDDRADDEDEDQHEDGSR